VALTSSADDDHLLEAYGVFAAEARDINADFHGRKPPHNSKAISSAFSQDFRRFSDPV
jgi:hypothetical protein